MFINKSQYKYSTAPVHNCNHGKKASLRGPAGPLSLQHPPPLLTGGRIFWRRSVTDYTNDNDSLLSLTVISTWNYMKWIYVLYLYKNQWKPFHTQSLTHPTRIHTRYHSLTATLRHSAQSFIHVHVVLQIKQNPSDLPKLNINALLVFKINDYQNEQLSNA